jgi:uncharacterized RDD family membrane protein YckC
MSDFPDNNRFTPPKAELADPRPLAGAPELAGRWMRLLAVFLDALVSTAITIAAMFATGHNYFTEIEALIDPGAFGEMFSIMFRSFAPGWIITIVVQGWFLYSHGGTLGKKLLGMRIVRTDGSRADFARLVFLRAGLTMVICMIPLIGGLVALVDMLLIFRDSRKCLHDNIADTIVVTTASSDAATLAPAAA